MWVTKPFRIWKERRERMMDTEQAIKDNEQYFKNRRNELIQESLMIDAKLKFLSKIESDVLGYLEERQRLEDNQGEDFKEGSK